MNLRGALGMLRPSPTDTEGVTQAMGQEAMRAIHMKWVAKYGPMTTDKVSFSPLYCITEYLSTLINTTIMIIIGLHLSRGE